jgi:enoyl-CoA hydratase/carnithine racemase
MEQIRFEVEDGIGRLTLTRPGKLNAQTPQMWHEMRQLAAEIGQSDELRVLVVTGEGPSFSSGLDVSVLAGGFAGSGAPDLEGMDQVAAIRHVQSSFTWLEEAPYPTVAAVRGHALGAGFQLALACDLRVVAEDADLGIMELRWGIMPDLGGTLWLPRLVGGSQALDLIWRSRRLSGTEAASMGLANEAVPEAELDARVDALVAELAALPPLAVRGAKRAVHAALAPADAALQSAAEEMAVCLRSEDLREAGAAYLEKRPPAYRGR